MSKPFAALSLLASFLLFFVQPLIAKIALPQLGGNAAVWTSAMVAFQLLLLVGYGYAHWLLTLTRRWQVLVHIALLAIALIWLPLGLDAAEWPFDTTGAVLSSARNDGRNRLCRRIPLPVHGTGSDHGHPHLDPALFDAGLAGGRRTFPFAG